MVHLEEGVTERPILKGSRWPARNHRGPVIGEPANARLAAETKPFRGGKTLLSGISWPDTVVAEYHRNGARGRCRHVANRGATADLSVSRSDLDIDRQVQLDETRLQQRHGQVIVQFNPGVGVAWRPPELLEDDPAGLSKR